MRILLAVDGSSSSDAVIQEAAWRLWPQGSEFAVVTVVDPYFFPRAPQLLQEAIQSTRKMLDEMARPLVDAGWTALPNVILDNVRHALPRAASEWRAQLLMMGSHGRGAVGRLLVGSTAQAVLRHAECSVEIVRSRRQGAEPKSGIRVLVPTDGSEHAEAALNTVAALPWPNGSQFLVIASPEYPALVGEYPFYAPEQMTELTKVSHEHAGLAAREGAEVLAKAKLAVGCQVTEPKDTPAHSILSAAEEWKADLVVMGSHGRRGFDRLILGSVSETVALHSHCSVEVVRMPLAVM